MGVGPGVSPEVFAGIGSDGSTDMGTDWVSTETEGRRCLLFSGSSYGNSQCWSLCEEEGRRQRMPIHHHVNKGSLLT
ncbi:hypothetical protein R6Q59_017479 [Mikania micrantha]